VRAVQADFERQQQSAGDECPSFRSATADARNGAEGIVQLLAAQGVDCLFLNPGTDTAPLQEALVALEARGHRVPRVVPSLFEGVAMAAAHGYFAITRRPQVVVVHVDVGTQNLGANLHNAQRGQAGVVILAGRTPYTVGGDVLGRRSSAIHWLQDVPDQIGIVRGYVKWAHELGRTDTLHHLVPRAFQIAASEPCGPVYLMAGREVLMEPMRGVSLELVGRSPPAGGPAGDPGAIARLAVWLADAEAPLAITGRLGRHPAAVSELVAFAELLGMPVADTRNVMNFPSSHPLYLGSGQDAYLASADTVLLLDVEVPWIPPAAAPTPHARIAQIDIDPTNSTIPLWGFPVDLPIQADTSKALPQLRAAIEELAKPERRARWEERRRKLSRLGTSRGNSCSIADRSARPLTLSWVAEALATGLPHDAIILDEAVTSGEVLRRVLRRDTPGAWLYSGGTGLGWGLGAALGAKLAAPSRDVVALCGDGAFVFGSPCAALWMARQAGAPFLAAVFNNAGYNASKLPVQMLFPDGASVNLDRFPGVRFSSPPDYAALARSCHAHGERVERPEELIPAIQRGIEATRQGQTAVLDLILAPI
jgi:acetolactate synthase-1/2/3 large subunit